jgi:hypothetical protein
VRLRSTADKCLVHEDELYLRVEGIEIPRREFEAFRAQQVRAYRMVWLAVIAAAVAVGFAIGELWSVAVGSVGAALVTLLGYEAVRRWNRARWIGRSITGNPDQTRTGDEVR